VTAAVAAVEVTIALHLLAVVVLADILVMVATDIILGHQLLVLVAVAAVVMGTAAAAA
jgi:hypothetical protein